MRGSFSLRAAALSLALTGSAQAQSPAAAPAVPPLAAVAEPAGPAAPAPEPAVVAEPAPARASAPPPAPASPPPSIHPIAPPSPRAAADHPAEGPAKPSRFYAGLGLGGGYFHASSGVPEDERTFRGGSFALQVAVGGRIGDQRMVTIGGGYVRDEAIGLSSKDEVVDGDEPTLDDLSMGLWTFGFFLDVAAQPVAGLHFQGVLGFSGIDVSQPGRNAGDPLGLGMNLGVGYDFSIGKHLSVGALLRGTIAALEVSEFNGTDVATFAPSLLLTAATR